MKLIPRGSLPAWNSTLSIPSSLSLTPSCPETYAYYICTASSNQFSGCCASDPCNASDNGVCSNIAPAKVASDIIGGTFPPQQCSGGSFYACDHNGGAGFLGCCTVDPCGIGSTGCAVQNLAPMIVAANPQLRSAFLNGIGFKSSGPLGTSASTADTTSSITTINQPFKTTGTSLLALFTPPSLAQITDTPSSSSSSIESTSTNTSTNQSIGQPGSGSPGSNPSGLIPPPPFFTQTVTNTGSDAPNPINNFDASNGSNNLAPGTKVGIAVGSVAAVAVLALIAFAFVRRRRDPTMMRLTSEDDLTDMRLIPERPPRPNTIVSMDDAIIKPLPLAKAGPSSIHRPWTSTFTRAVRNTAGVRLFSSSAMATTTISAKFNPNMHSVEDGRQSAMSGTTYGHNSRQPSRQNSPDHGTALSNWSPLIPQQRSMAPPQQQQQHQERPHTAPQWSWTIPTPIAEEFSTVAPTNNPFLVPTTSSTEPRPQRTRGATTATVPRLPLSVRNPDAPPRYPLPTFPSDSSSSTMRSILINTSANISSIHPALRPQTSPLFATEPPRNFSPTNFNGPFGFDTSELANSLTLMPPVLRQSSSSQPSVIGSVTSLTPTILKPPSPSHLGPRRASLEAIRESIDGELSRTDSNKRLSYLRRSLSANDAYSKTTTAQALRDIEKALQLSRNNSKHSLFSPPPSDSGLLIGFQPGDTVPSWLSHSSYSHRSNSPEQLPTTTNTTKNPAAASSTSPFRPASNTITTVPLTASSSVTRSSRATAGERNSSWSAKIPLARQLSRLTGSGGGGGGGSSSSSFSSSRPPSTSRASNSHYSVGAAPSLPMLPPLPPIPAEHLGEMLAKVQMVVRRSSGGLDLLSDQGVDTIAATASATTTTGTATPGAATAGVARPNMARRSKSFGGMHSRKKNLTSAASFAEMLSGGIQDENGNRNSLKRSSSVLELSSVQTPAPLPPRRYGDNSIKPPGWYRTGYFAG